MEYVIAALAGFIYGGLIGLGKYFFLWRGIMRAKDEVTVTAKMVYARLGISWIVNLATLLGVFFARDVIPLDFAATAIGAAVGLSLSGKFFSLHKIEMQ